MTHRIASVLLLVSALSACSMFQKKPDESAGGGAVAPGNCFAGPYNNGKGVHCKAGDYYYENEGKCHSSFDAKKCVAAE